MKKKILVLCIILIMSITSISAYALETADVSISEKETVNNSDTVIDKEILDYAKNWILNNYGEFYDIRNINAHIVRQVDTTQKSRYTVSLTCETMYKYKKIEEIPFVQGLMSVCKKKTVNSNAKSVIDQKISQIEQDASFGEYTELCVDVVVEVDNTNNSTGWKLYYQDGMDTTLHDISALSLNSEELYNQGVQTAEAVLLKNENPVDVQSTRGYSSYDRFAARDYARQYSSNPTKCNRCSDCDTLQNTAKWNTDQYPYYDNPFLHNDCADFVSQAMSAGGIPEKSGWYRTKEGSKGTWTQSWTVVSKLEAYMTRTDHVYWDESTFSACNAGNILITNSGAHVVMVDFNDGTTHKFTGHTNDRKSYVFGNVSSYKYYVINRNS